MEPTADGAVSLVESNTATRVFQFLHERTCSNPHMSSKYDTACFIAGFASTKLVYGDENSNEQEKQHAHKLGFGTTGITYRFSLPNAAHTAISIWIPSIRNTHAATYSRFTEHNANILMIQTESSGDVATFTRAHVMGSYIQQYIQKKVKTFCTNYPTILREKNKDTKNILESAKLAVAQKLSSNLFSISNRGDHTVKCDSIGGETSCESILKSFEHLIQNDKNIQISNYYRENNLRILLIPFLHQIKEYLNCLASYSCVEGSNIVCGGMDDVLIPTFSIGPQGCNVHTEYFAKRTIDI
jgi:hypothetical protein